MSQTQIPFMKVMGEGHQLTLDEVWPRWWCPGVHGWRGPSRGWGTVLAWRGSHAGWGSSRRGSSMARWGSARPARPARMHGSLHVAWGRGCASWSRPCHHHKRSSNSYSGTHIGPTLGQQGHGHFGFMMISQPRTCRVKSLVRQQHCKLFLRLDKTNNKGNTCTQTSSVGHHSPSLTSLPRIRVIRGGW